MLCSCDTCTNTDTLFKNLQEMGKNLRYSERLNQSLNFLSILGNIDRLIIINVLKEKDRCVCELEAILDKSQPSISHHLRELEKLDLIRGWKKGKYTYYSLNLDMLDKLLNQTCKFLNFE
jgi:DNA-binding transcriptional ArsR family regulator